MPLDFSFATLNVWGLPHPYPLGSRLRRYRIGKLIEALAESSYDVVVLQELWDENDYLSIARTLSSKFPFTHYFHSDLSPQADIASFSGFTGSGNCVLSQHPIISTLVHRYSLNGFPHHIHRGDWFGGKIVGMAEIKLRDLHIFIYTTHLHAEYNRQNDLYLPHRISQCFELAKFVLHTSRDADFLILAGDFNIEPNDLGYHVVRRIAELNDAWDCRPNQECDEGPADGGTIAELGMTSERPDNCFTNRFALRNCPEGKRIDYILYGEGGQGLELKDCRICFNHIPQSTLCANYSDHVGLAASFVVKEEEVPSKSSSQRRHQLRIEKALLEKSQRIVEEGEMRVLWDRRLFLALCFILCALIVATLNVETPYPFFSILVGLIRFCCTLMIAFSFWHGFIGLSIEMKALKETKYSIRKMIRSLEMHSVESLSYGSQRSCTESGETHSTNEAV